MKYKFLDKEQKYDGSQLHSHFGYENDVNGNSIVCFIGPAEVKEHLVDCEDILKNDFISSEHMMHFIIEIFDASLRETVVWQRLFITQIIDFLKENLQKGYKIYRLGDDVFINDKKFSVSIATLSPVSGLVHVGLNINVGEGCPVKAIGFYSLLYSKEYYDMGWDYHLGGIARDIMNRFVEEFKDIENACYKVKGVK